MVFSELLCTLRSGSVLPQKNVTPCPDTGRESSRYRLAPKDDHQSLQTASNDKYIAQQALCQRNEH